MSNVIDARHIFERPGGDATAENVKDAAIALSIPVGQTVALYGDAVAVGALALTIANMARGKTDDPELRKAMGEIACTLIMEMLEGN